MTIKDQIAYLKDNPHGYWFKAKLYGWGWTPATWQGWVVLLVYIAVLMWLSLTIDKATPTDQLVRTFVAPISLLTALLLAICYKTGEKPRWQWGPPKNQK